MKDYRIEIERVLGIESTGEMSHDRACEAITLLRELLGWFECQYHLERMREIIGDTEVIRDDVYEKHRAYCERRQAVDEIKKQI